MKLLMTLQEMTKSQQECDQGEEAGRASGRGSAPVERRALVAEPSLARRELPEVLGGLRCTTGRVSAAARERGGEEAEGGDGPWGPSCRRGP